MKPTVLLYGHAFNLASVPLLHVLYKAPVHPCKVAQGWEGYEQNCMKK